MTGEYRDGTGKYGDEQDQLEASEPENPIGNRREPSGTGSGTGTGTGTGTVPGRFPTSVPEPDPVRIYRTWAEVDADPEQPVAVLPGLAWRRRLSVLVGGPKLGKTTLVAQALAAQQQGIDFLGAPTGLGRVAIVDEMGAEWVKSWIARHGVEKADIDFLPPCKLTALCDYLKHREPALLVVDTLIAFAAANGSDENSSNDIRSLMAVVRSSGAAVLLTHHTRRDSDEFRGSGDVLGAPDQMITMKRGRLRVAVAGLLGSLASAQATARLPRRHRDVQRRGTGGRSGEPGSRLRADEPGHVPIRAGGRPRHPEGYRLLVGK